MTSHTLNAALIYNDVFHLLIFRVENDFLILIISEVTFQCILIIHKGNYYIAIIGFYLLFNNHKVAVIYPCINHRLTACS